MESPAAQVGSPGSQYLSNPDAACSPTFKDWPLAQISEYFRLYSWEKLTLNSKTISQVELCVEVNLPLHGLNTLYSWCIRSVVVWLRDRKPHFLHKCFKLCETVSWNQIFNIKRLMAQYGQPLNFHTPEFIGQNKNCKTCLMSHWIELFYILYWILHWVLKEPPVQKFVYCSFVYNSSVLFLATTATCWLSQITAALHIKNL